MKVLVYIPVDESEEPYQAVNFITGYESTGLTFTGTITIWDNTNIDYMYSTGFALALSQGYDIVYSPTALQTVKYRQATDYYYSQGMLTVAPAGSNFYNTNYNPYVDHVVDTSGGKDENVVGYNTEFFDVDLQSNGDNPVMYINQMGGQYDISEVRRVSSSVLEIKLADYTTRAELYSIGFFDHGVPITVSVFTGTDLGAPGEQYTSTTYVTSNGIIGVNFTTGTGTIGLWQEVETGMVTLGQAINDVAQQTGDVLIKVTSYFFAITGWGVHFSGITGFDNNLDGGYPVSAYVNSDGFGDKLTITHTLGNGAYNGGGIFRIDTESNSLPYIAGKLAAIKDTLKCSWWEARYRARKTASYADSYTAVNGYGLIDADAAIAYTGTIINDPNAELTGTPVLTAYSAGEIYWIRLYVTGVDNATEYEFYRNNVLIATQYVQTANVFGAYNYQVSGFAEVGDPYNFRVKAKRGNKYKWSDVCLLKKQKSKFLLINPETA